ncbi:glycosyl transferase group 1 [Clostridium sp. BJN0001]|uniref:glycosyl transferase group 1 n=1 Tax=Clostridium sp. BJN0001 TaxID=2930219 RepID=UPI001FD24356|nr:glycosyl transferase group 1 [Clostridium sp. BJN0001]
MKILFIACYSPIINNSAAIETLQYLNKLAEIKENTVHLLTVDFPCDSIYYDDELYNMMDKNIVIHKIDGGFIFDKIIPRRRSDSVNKISNKISRKRKLLRKIKNAVVIPDMYYIWAKKASKYAKNLMEKEKFDVLFSMHEPPSSHLCALYLKKKFKDIPWITYWSDPWLKDSTRQKNFILKKIIEKHMEKKIVNVADKFIFVTKSNRNDYMKDYKKLTYKNTYILNRGFDQKLYNKLSLNEVPDVIKKDKINFIYAGEIFSKLRDIKPFVDALYKLKENDREKYEMINVLFFGNIDDIEMKEKLEKLDIAKVSRRIPFNEALKVMINSQLLLLFGNKNSKQIPAKIYDYFGCKARILVIYGDQNDPIKSITENNEKCIVTDNNTDEILDKIYKVIEFHQKNDLLKKPDLNYEWEAVAKKLNDILRSDISCI